MRPVLIVTLLGLCSLLSLSVAPTPRPNFLTRAFEEKHVFKEYEYINDFKEENGGRAPTQEEINDKVMERAKSAYGGPYKRKVSKMSFIKVKDEDEYKALKEYNGNTNAYTKKKTFPNGKTKNFENFRTPQPYIVDQYEVSRGEVKHIGEDKGHLELGLHWGKTGHFETMVKDNAFEHLSRTQFGRQTYGNLLPSYPSIEQRNNAMDIRSPANERSNVIGRDNTQPKTTPNFKSSVNREGSNRVGTVQGRGRDEQGGFADQSQGLGGHAAPGEDLSGVGGQEQGLGGPAGKDEGRSGVGGQEQGLGDPDVKDEGRSGKGVENEGRDDN